MRKVTATSGSRSNDLHAFETYSLREGEKQKERERGREIESETGILYSESNLLFTEKSISIDG